MKTLTTFAGNKRKPRRNEKHNTIPGCIIINPSELAGKEGHYEGHEAGCSRDPQFIHAQGKGGSSASRIVCR